MSTSIAISVGLIYHPTQHFLHHHVLWIQQHKLLQAENSAAPENLIQTKPFSILNSTNRLDIILKHQSTNSTPYTFSRSIISTGLTHTNLNPPKFISCLTAIVRPNKGCVHEAFHWSVEWSHPYFVSIFIYWKKQSTS